MCSNDVCRDAQLFGCHVTQRDYFMELLESSALTLVVVLFAFALFAVYTVCWVLLTTKILH